MNSTVILGWYRPRRRRLEAFTTDAQIIRLISGRVAFFSDGCSAAVFRRQLRRSYIGLLANLQKFSGVIPADLRPCGLLGQRTVGRITYIVLVQTLNHAQSIKPRTTEGRLPR